jgi:hypothetical protein
MKKTTLINFTENKFFESIEVEVLESIIYQNKIFYFHKSTNAKSHPYHLSYLFVGDLWTETRPYRKEWEDSFKKAKEVVLVEKIEKLPLRLKGLEEYKLNSRLIIK